MSDVPTPDRKPLFIGGRNDGRRITVPDLPIILVPIPSGGHSPQTEQYRKERLTTERLTFSFYVSESISTETAIGRLLDHYTPIKEEAA